MSLWLLTAARKEYAVSMDGCWWGTNSVHSSFSNWNHQEGLLKRRELGPSPEASDTIGLG